MSLETTGVLKEKFGLQEITDKFSKREFVITILDENGKSKYDQHCIFQLTNANTALLDRFEVGDEITVYFNLRGRPWKDKYFNNLEAWKLDGNKWSKPLEPNKDFQKEKEFPASLHEDDEPLPF